MKKYIILFLFLACPVYAQEDTIWALVATSPTEIPNPAIVTSADLKTMPPRIGAPAGTVVSIIVYDGVSPYTPPPNTILQQVPADTVIGQLVPSQ